MSAKTHTTSSSSATRKRAPAVASPAARSAARSAASLARKAPARRQARAVQPKAAAQPAESVAKAAKPEKAVNAKVAKKPAKSRAPLVRDSFTMPEVDFALIATLKATALGARRAAKKSELLRAGLHALAALDTKALLAALDKLEPVKTGRPKKGH